MRKFGVKGSSIITVLAISSVATAIPVIAFWEVLRGLASIGYAPYVMAYSLLFVALSLTIMRRGKSVEAARRLEFRALIYLAIMASMVIILGIY